MNEEELKELQRLYDGGVQLDVVKDRLVAGGQEQVIPEVEEFYQKKKDFGVEDSVSKLEDTVSLSNLPVTLASEQLPKEFNEFAEKSPVFGPRDGIIKDVLGGMVSDDPSEGKRNLFIVDDDPSELGRLYNRGRARGRIAKLMAEQRTTGYTNLEDLAYFNSILQRDAPRESDLLKLNQDKHPIASFVLDLATMLPESLIASFSAPEVTIPASVAGATAGSFIPFFGNIGGALAGFFGSGSGAVEYAGSFFEALQEQGVDVTDEEQLRDVLFKQTPEGEQKLKKAALSGAQKGIPIGILDGITAGRGGQFLKQAIKKGTSRNIAALKEIGFDSALGAGGETIGQAAQGKDIQWRDVLLEGAAGPFTGAPGAVYNYYATEALTPGERNYSRWAGTQEADKLNESMTVALASDNGRIGIIDSKIQKIKRDLKKPGQKRAVRKALSADLRNLTNEKYTSLLEIQEQLVGLDSEVFDKAKDITKEIFASVEALREGNLSATERAAVERQINENGKALTELTKIKKEDTETADTQTETKDTQTEKEEFSDSQIPKSRKRYRFKNPDDSITFVEVTTNLDGSRRTRVLDEDGSILQSNSGSIPEGMNEEFWIQGSFGEKGTGEILGSEDIDISTVRNPKMEQRMSDRQKKAAGIEVKPEEPTSEKVTDDIYNDFVDTGNVSTGVLSSIADKIISNETLTEQERAIYAEKGSEIEKQLKQKQKQQEKSTSDTIIDERKSSEDVNLEASRNRFKNDRYLNLFDPNDVAVLKEEMDNFSPGDRVEIQKMILASESYRSITPDAKDFIIGFTQEGYEKGAKAAGFRDTSNSYGITNKRGSIAQLLGAKAQRKKADRAAYKTAYHEVLHNVFANYFDSNPVDFNQFRELILRRLKDADSKMLNDFAELYSERPIGSYQSEEFMVELGARLGDNNVEFSASILEEIRAFLNNIIRKITNNRVQLFEDAGLAKDIEGYLTGVTEAIRTGSDLKKVKVSDRLKGDRFKRVPESVKVKRDPETQEEEFIGTEARNLEGRPDPESYERQKEALEPILDWIRSKTENTLKGLEKITGITRLRGINKKIVQAQEVASSMPTQILNRLFLTGQRIKKAITKLSKEEQQRIIDLANEYYYSEDRDAQTKALQEIIKKDEVLAEDIVLLKSLLEDQQKRILDNPAFNSLSDDLLQTIKDSVGKYGVRSYRIYTDPNFKIDPELRKAAEKDLIDQALFELEQKILDGEGDMEAIREYFEEAYGPGAEDIITLIDIEPDSPQARPYISEYVRLGQIEKVQRDVKKLLQYYDDVANNRENIRKGYTGDPDMSDVRIRSKNLMRRQDLPESLRKMMGEEDNAFIRMVTSVTNLAQMNANFTMINKLNEISRENGMGSMILRPSEYDRVNQLVQDSTEKLSDETLTGIARILGLLESNETVSDLIGRNDIENSEDAQRYIANFFKDNYTVIKDKRSPMDGKAVSNEFLSMVKQTPMYQAKGEDLRDTFLQGYYNTLLQMRKVRVLYNLPTWRKNIMGGWYFLAANGVFGYNADRGGLTVMKDLKNRLKKVRTGETDPEMEAVLDKLAELGLLGASLNQALVGDINSSYYDMASGGDPNAAWSWLPKYLQEQQKKLGTKSSRIAYQYGYIDDYTKVIAYLHKRENFAKRLASNPEGKSYDQLTPEQQMEVDLAVVERIKQNMPTMSRISPAFRNIMQLPFGDFLSFRLEAFRSFFSIYKNALADINEGVSNNNLTESQRNAFMLDGFRSLSMGAAMSTMSAAGYKFIANQFLDDEEDIELSGDIRGANYVLPPWMVGSNIIPVSMKKDGTVRLINISSEDPYDEMQGLIYGRDGISRSKSLMSIFKDFSDPNLAVRLFTNLIDGKNGYGAPIVRNEDATWFNRWIIGSTLSDWSNAYGSYVFKEMFIPPNINYVAKQVRKRIKEGEENPDAQLDPISTALQLGTSLVFRDYPVNISKQFYYNLEDQNFFTPYKDLSKREKFNRKVRLNEIKTGYDFIKKYGNKFENFGIIRSASKSIKNKFRKSRAEQLYLLYNIDLPE